MARKSRSSAPIGLLALALVAGLAPVAAGAESEQHCVVEVIDQEADGRFITTAPTCYPTFDQVQAHVDRLNAESSGSTSPASSSSGVEETSLAASGSFLIGVHYEHRNYGGDSLSVVGDDCTGGYLNLKATWNNRISSTKHGCPTIRHFEYLSLQGSWADTYTPGGNLPSWIDNQTSSIQYLG